jgi:manganese oxidase
LTSRNLSILLTFTALLSGAPRSAQPAPAGERTQIYFIAAEETLWDYAPHGRNVAGLPHPESEEAGAGGTTRYWKALYREYTDATFSTPKVREPQWAHLGLLGPLIRAEVGDTVQIVFRNNTHVMCSMHPHGLAYDKTSEGASYDDGSTVVEKKDDFVHPGDTFTYTWRVPERAGPAHGDGSSVLWMYHSHFSEGKDVNSGLIGPIIVTARGSSKPDGSPVDVDREFITSFAVFDESESWLFEKNLVDQKKAPLSVRRATPGDRLPYLFYTINGLIDGNLPLLLMKKGERVRWYLFASSNDDDVHTPHWHGETVTAMHMRSDTVQLTPMGMSVADMVADEAGTWLFHCHNNDHFEGGMVALFRVLP